jgi:hypothetical protein
LREKVLEALTMLKGLTVVLNSDIEFLAPIMDKQGILRQMVYAKAKGLRINTQHATLSIPIIGDGLLREDLSICHFIYFR